MLPAIKTITPISARLLVENPTRQTKTPVSSQPTATTLLGLILSIRAPRISTPIPPPSGNRAVIIEA